MSRFTPGPWFVGLPGGPAGPFYSLVNSAGNVIAMQIPRKEDARLIRVTPELLAACKAALNRLCPMPEDLYEQLRAAISAADEPQE